MSALSEALAQSQRQTISALSKAYIAGRIDGDDLLRGLDESGSTDRVDQEHLIVCLNLLREHGQEAPTNAPPAKVDRPASPEFIEFLQRLADEKGTVLPDYPLSNEQGKKIRDQLKAGTYNPDEWTVPF
jgi:hypothetical protein